MGLLELGLYVTIGIYWELDLDPCGVHCTLQKKMCQQILLDGERSFKSGNA